MRLHFIEKIRGKDFQVGTALLPKGTQNNGILVQNTVLRSSLFLFHGIMMKSKIKRKIQPNGLKLNSK